MARKMQESMTLEELARKEALKAGSKWRAYVALYEAWRDGRLVIEDPNPPRSFVTYLARLDYSAWFWTGIALLALSTASIPLSSAVEAFTYVRYVLGTLLVLFLPGYALIEALYPRRESLSPLERLALSIGLSLALVPLVGLVLNYTPYGIRLEPIVTSLNLLTASLLLLGAWRKYGYVRAAASAKALAASSGQ